MRDAFVRVLTKAATADPRVMLVTGDLGFGVLTDYAKQFPKQYLNAGVAEQNMTAVACGMALEGRKVFTYSIGNFPTLRCLEQLRNDVCYHDADVTIVAIGGGFSYGQLGMSHFATEDLAILRALPGMKVFAPTSIWEATETVKALLASRGPSYLRLDKSAAPDPEPGEVFAIGRARVVREGRDVCLIATGAILSEALAAADLLAADRVNASVIAVHSVKPLDSETIVAAARQCGGIVTVEEHTIVGGLGSAVAEVCTEAGAAPHFLMRVGLKDMYPTVVGDQKFLRMQYNMDGAAIAKCALSALARPA